jgi:phosphate-selective porin OprO and OprP
LAPVQHDRGLGNSVCTRRRSAGFLCALLCLALSSTCFTKTARSDDVLRPLPHDVATEQPVVPLYAPEPNGQGTEPFFERERDVDGLPLRARFDDGFTIESLDSSYQLRIRVLNQVDGKLFDPTSQEPARSGLYIPRFRIYFEGQLTDPFEYELSLQRSVEGAFDVLDANANFKISDELQVRVGRALVPYSFAWYDHLEQFYITPSRTAGSTTSNFNTPSAPPSASSRDWPIPTPRATPSVTSIPARFCIPIPIPCCAF